MPGAKPRAEGSGPARTGEGVPGRAARWRRWLELSEGGEGGRQARGSDSPLGLMGPTGSTCRGKLKHDVGEVAQEGRGGQATAACDTRWGCGDLRRGWVGEPGRLR